MDETPWSLKGIKEWLRVFSNFQFLLIYPGDTHYCIELKMKV